jgi:hypothetical protein
MNIFKKLFVPSGEKQELTEQQSWTVKWTAYRSDILGRGTPFTRNKVFIDYDEAKKFKHELKEARKLLGDRLDNEPKIIEN